ncbi:heterolocus tagous nuclear ribonucleoprotein [Echinococcus multilocularis]|uniref:Heterolocus tagous nuclear ribonucleoprotein n=1 Tax=Echinococcus multilocularis TaxID=6211 RepID=A0A068YNJ6_ECHMU|nr:heterolocus tagous nuclear ribonucleoprotein [Echinococcus multilocularis]
MMDAVCENLERNPNDVEKSDEIKGDSPSVVENNTAEKHPDGSGDATVQSESDDDVRKLFVGGLNWETTSEDLQSYFSQWGNVTRCIIKIDRFTGHSRGFGFVTFENEDSVNKVLSVPEHKLMGKRIDPKRAKPSREAMKKIFVGGIDPELTEERIKEYFSQFGQVESLDLPFDLQKGKRKHYIFVSFATEAAARKAIAKERQEIHGRLCDVRVAVTKDQANKNKNMKCLGYIDPAYAAYAPYPYGDYSSAYASLDPYTYGGYYGCYDYFGAAANPSTATGGYGIYANYATNSALFRGQYGAGRSNNAHHPHHNAAAASAAPNPHYQNSAAAAVAAAAPGAAAGGAGAMGYPAAAPAVTNSSSHWNPAEPSAPSVPTFDYAAAAPHP